MTTDSNTPKHVQQVMLEADMFRPPYHQENTREWAGNKLQMNRIEYIEKFGWLLCGQQAEADFGR